MGSETQDRNETYQKVIKGVSTENVELDELHSFAGAKHPDEQVSDPDEIGRHWTRCAMARELRLLLARLCPLCGAGASACATQRTKSAPFFDVIIR
jgi:hypothetical protein